MTALAAMGVIPTVYSLVYPQTRAVFDELRATPGLSDMYEQAWEKHQDPMHHALFDHWQAWTKPVLEVDWARFPHRYVSAGSSEAIRDSIAAHVAGAHQAGRLPRIHVFEGEYEGFAAYADAYHCEVVRHDRADYEGSLGHSAHAGDRVYLSAPSSIDGMVWSELPAFLGHLQQAHPQVRVAVDLCYVGCVGSGAYRIDLRAPNIDTVFFSLSKVFGVYYHRIGGVLSTAPMPGLHGNVWFKNLLSIRYGVALMQRYGVSELPGKLRPQQRAVVEQMRGSCGSSVQPADAVLLAVQAAGDTRLADPSPFARGQHHLRYCLTPALDRAIKERA